MGLKSGYRNYDDRKRRGVNLVIGTWVDLYGGWDMGFLYGV